MENKLENSELTEYERKTLVPALVAGFNKMVGKKNAFTIKQILAKLQKLGYQTDERRLLICIDDIRKNNLVAALVGTQKGYYKADNKEDLEEYLKSLYERKVRLEHIITSIENSIIIF